MNDLTYAWLITASISLVFFFAAAAVGEENSQAQYLNASQFNNPGFDESDYNNYLPDAGAGQSDNDFTDEYRVTQSWLGSRAGDSYITQAITMPHSILKAMGLPSVVSVGFGIFWWSLLILLTVMMILGRER